MISSIQPQVAVKPHQPRKADVAAAQHELDSSPVDQAELCASGKAEEVQVAKKSSQGFVKGLKKTALVAALAAATMGSMSTPAMAQSWGSGYDGYNHNRSVAVQVDPCRGVTIASGSYNPYTGTSEHVAVSFGRQGVRVEAGVDNPWAPPPVVVMPNPGYYEAPVVMPNPQVIYQAPVVIRTPVYVRPAMVMPYYHHHNNWGWGR